MRGETALATGTQKGPEMEASLWGSSCEGCSSEVMRILLMSRLPARGVGARLGVGLGLGLRLGLGLVLGLGLGLRLGLVLGLGLK